MGCRGGKESGAQGEPEYPKSVQVEDLVNMMRCGFKEELKLAAVWV